MTMFKQSVVRSAISAGLSVLMLAATSATAQSFGAVQTAPMMTMQGPGQVFQGQKWHGFSNQRAASAIIDQNNDGLVPLSAYRSGAAGRWGLRERSKTSRHVYKRIPETLPTP
jgi:hypothetical protein